MNDKDKLAALDAALAQIEKQFGKGSVMKLGSSGITTVDVIPTGSLALDLALGVGGVPRGRVGRYMVRNLPVKQLWRCILWRRRRKPAVWQLFIDAEHALDPVYAKNLGVNIDELLISQPDTGEQALEIAEALVRSGALDVIVVDSVAALVPRQELEGEMGDAHVGLQARLMSQALRKLTGAVAKSNVCFIFINQIREKVGVMFGNPETTSGGRALKFYASVRIEVRRADVIKNGSEMVGSRTKVKVVKNKVAPPFKQAEFDIMYGKGISTAGNILDIGVEMKLIDKAGSWFSYQGERIGQGRENAKDYLMANPAVMDEIEAKIRAKAAGATEPMLEIGMPEATETAEQPEA